MEKRHFLSVSTIVDEMMHLLTVIGFERLKGCS